MSDPCIITVAITGSVPRKKDNPAIPITVSEQIESTHEAFEAGATVVHVHVRNEDETPTAAPERFAAYLEGVRKACPEMIVQYSTGGRSGKGDERGGMLSQKPDMASLATGSCNFPTIIYENSPALIEDLADKMKTYGIKPEIEVFDLAMLFNAVNMTKAGLLDSPLHVQFVMGVKNALPARRDVLEFEINMLRELAPDATWVAAGIGRHQEEVNRWCLELGGHCRTGLEDNIRMDRDTLAPSNAALVKKVADMCGEYDRRPATPAEAREILSLPAA
ncbi:MULTISPECIES: 3-keto-5-aminohexanoate cleavage protein [Euryhalocaulis]|uniref:3-keto-5-aminohexanoate cleavage protein n=1 Tax=Euryhalocaulis TaxID=1712422 RepID=UPI0003A64150|nr:MULTISPECIES: 3-keto-5-aminohexanoate cleavage protein [Euryhalocaulis]MBA4800850.1 3-keto-5-aminohexanoate cleavage protein [Euryhalocaulis sp.]